MYGMQMLLHIGVQFAIDFDVKFNVALRMGALFYVPCVFFVLSGAELKFVNKIKYVGIYVCASNHFKCLIEHIKQNFFRSLNCILYHSKFAMSELVSVSYCLPVLLYGSEAVCFSKSDVNKLRNCLNIAPIKYSIYLRL